MRYFSTLPQSKFTSSIGTFTISSFFSYYEYDYELLNKVEKEVDNKTTLTELSNQIYQDNNSLWLFMIANNTTDPYELLAQDPTLYKKNIENHIALGIQPYVISGTTSSSYVFTSGSIITPFSNTYGSPWQYSSVGSWDLDGPFALVDSTDYYNGSMVIKEQKGTTPFIGVDSAHDDVSIIQPSGSTYTTNESVGGEGEAIYQTKNKSDVDNQIVYVKDKNTGEIYPTDVNYPPVVTGQAFAPPVSGATIGISNYDIVVDRNKNIYILPPSSLPALRLKTFKY